MARLYRNALLSAIVKRLTPEGQPQLLGRGAALSPLVVRGGDVEVEVCDPVFVDPERVRLNSLSRAACSCAARGLRSAQAVWRSFGQAGARDQRAHVVDQKRSRVQV